MWLSSSLVLIAYGSKVVIIQPASATTQPSISNFVTGFNVANLKPTIMMEQRLEYRLAWDIIVYVAPQVKNDCIPIKPIAAYKS